jgi:flagellar protein FlbB
MSSYSRVGAGPRIFVLVLLLVVLIGGGLLWFDYLGLIDVRSALSPVLRAVGLEAPEQLPDTESRLVLDQARLEKREAALEEREAALEQRTQELQSLEQELEAQQQELAAQEQELEDRENSFNQRVEQFENRRAVLEQNARALTSMRPQDAVEILQGYDDQLLIDTLRVAEELAQEQDQLSIVPVWLSQLPADRAAEIQRKMTLKPQSDQ